MSAACCVQKVTLKGHLVRWHVQRRVDGQRHDLGFFDSEDEAFLALQRKWPQEKKNLTKESLTAAKANGDMKIEDDGYWSCRGVGPKRYWEGVTWEAGRKKWKVQPSGPRFSDQREAALCYAKSQRKTLKSIALPDEKGVDHRFSNGMLQQEFAANMMLQPFITPGDLCDTDRRVDDAVSKRAFQRQPGILPVFFVCKLSRTKSNIISKVLKTPMPATSSHGSTAVRHLYDVLIAVALQENGTRWPKEWYESVNRTQFHWMNFWVHLMRMNLLKRIVSPQGSTKGLLKFDDGKSYFKIQPFSDVVARSLQTNIDWGTECLAQSSSPTRHRTIQDAAKIVLALSTACPVLHGAKLNENYLRQWLNRCAVYYCMRCKKVKRMVVGQSTVRDFLNLDFPDEHEVVLPLLSRPNLYGHYVLTSKLADAFSDLGYKGPPELFHMYACFFSNDQYVEVVRSKSATWIQRHIKTMGRWAKNYFSTHGINPHPRLIVQAHSHLP